MPGLDQLKQFNSDVLALGGEAEKRASRGEQIVRVPIPRTVKPVDDSEDFVLGMPEISEEELAQREKEKNATQDDDFSDITGEKSSSQSEAQEDAEPEIQLDMSSLLTPIAEVSTEDVGVPDLSAFIEESPKVEEPPKETSIADMSLDDLLGKSDFDLEDAEPLDAYDEVIEEEPPAPPPLKEEVVVPNIPGAPILDFIEEPVSSEPKASATKIDEPAIDENVFGDADFASDIGGTDFASDIGDADFVSDVPKFDDTDFASDIGGIDFASDTGDTSDTDFSFSGEAINLNEGLPSELNEDFGFDFNDDVPPPSETDVGVQSSDESFGQESFSQDNFADESFGGDDFAGDSFVDENAPIETFDTSAMEGLDFTVTESENKTELELGSDDFEIPGFSDTVTAKTDKSGRIKLPTPDFAGAKEGAAPVKNALTDGQYKKFRENLSFYPLNVRIAIESLLVKNEFTDEAQFEVIEKVLNKVAARQLASHLEKMLDISIPVPRDFERRSAAEYEAYKASLQYQLRNRIIPGVILGIVSLALLFGLIVFSRNFIYKPLRANGLYKQGYALIQANEYQQSEMKFIEATSYDLQKKWFFKYARSYREHKQYLRAEKMYKNILNYFNHDKIAGIEYAQMECDELGNYEKAEEIAKREVLDYHINDKDGILLLGDIYLEWATEKEPSKFEEARKQYALLVQLYGDENIYMARMLRYFVRTDNLREVLELKERFYPKGKGFTPDDWTEMSGYLLDKQYGHLSPSDEYLRTSIEDVRDMLNRAVSENPSNPVATYNLSRYFIHMNMSDAAIKSLEKSTVLFKNAPRRRRKDAYKEIDTYRLLGEEYVKQKEFLKAQEAYTGGIVLYEEEKLSSGFEGNEQIGKLYADAGDIDYFIRGNLDSAYDEYTTAVNTHYDTPSIRYRLGYIEYGKENYSSAIRSFIKANESNPGNTNLLLALGNSLTLRNDVIAASSYYESLVENLDRERVKYGVLLPQLRAEQAELVELYLRSTNNLGVAQHKLAKRTGNSELNAKALVNLSTSIRAWDALTRNQETMIRLSGSNLAEQNMKYITHPHSEYEPALYTEISKTLSGEKELTQ